MSRPPIIAVALDNGGDHPAAWRHAVAHPATLLTGQWITDQVARAEQAGVDLVTLGDGPLAPDPDSVLGRVDAVLALSRAAAATTSIGLVPTVATTHTEPFHLASAVATLDFVSTGRAGWQISVSETPQEAALIGRRSVAAPPALWREAGQVADLSRQLWDSWQDDAVIRDVTTGRFVDRDRLHHVNFRGVDSVGESFSVIGPSIVPRPPQGHPVIVVRVDPHAFEQQQEVIARWAEVIILDSSEPTAAHRALTRIRDLIARSGRTDVRVLAGLSVLVGSSGRAAVERLAELDHGRSHHPVDFVGTGPALARHVEQLVHNGFDGVQLRPAVLGPDVDLIYRSALPLLQQGRVVKPGPTTLRDRLGLPRPVNRHLTASVTETAGV